MAQPDDSPRKRKLDKELGHSFPGIAPWSSFMDEIEKTTELI
jgi:hypothetical protein